MPGRTPLLATTLCCVAGVLGAATAGATKDPWEPPSTRGWVEARSAHFTVYSGAGEDHAKKIAVQLERFRQTLSRISKGLALDDRFPTAILAFRNDPSFTPYKLDERGKPASVSGYFLSTPFRNYIALDTSAGSSRMRVVYHEYFHQVLEATVGEVPLWLNEGLAEFFSTFRTEDRGAVVQVGHPIEEHLVFLGQRGTIAWEDVFRTTTDSPTYQEGTRQGSFYAQSWLIAHYMAATDTRLKALGRYLSLLRDGVDPDQGLQTAFGLNRAALGVEVGKYSKKVGNYIWFDLGEESAKVDVAIRELAPAEVLYRLGDLLAHRHGGESASRHLEAARSGGWPAPEVETSLGAAALSERDSATAEEHLRKAVAAGAGSAEPHVLLGYILMDRAAGKGRTGTPASTVPPEIEEARGLFRKALEKDGESFPALLAYASTFAFESKTEPGLEALARARQLRPHDWDALRLGACLLARGGKPAAAGTLIESAIAPRNPAVAREAARCVAQGAAAAAIDRMQASDPEAAQKILSEALETVRDPSARSNLESLQQVAASGGKVVISESADPRIESYNEAMELARSGKLAEAATRLEALAKDCTGVEVCARARETAGRMRRSLAKKEWVATYNRAVELVNDGKRKDAITLLRQLERVVDDPELLAGVQELLGKLGQKPAR